MLLINQDFSQAINSGNIISIDIVKMAKKSKKLADAFPGMCQIVARGKKDKAYILGTYADKDEAQDEITDLYESIEKRAKGHHFGVSRAMLSYFSKQED